MSSNVILIHVGQAGLQIGNALWELFCVEHCITPDGECLSELTDTSMQTFYQEVNNGKYIPRALFLDSEESVIDEIRTGVYKNLYHPNQLINGTEDAANNFARGSFISGSKCIHIFRSRLQKLVEEVDHLESILFFNSAGGGSGSGLGALLLQQIFLDFPKICKFQMPVNPSAVMSTAVVEPYNAIFHGHTTMETVDLSVMLENESLYNMCQRLLFILTPTYSNVNRLIAMMVSAITCSIRFHSSVHTGIQEMYTNLIPYPRIHYAIVAHSPIQEKVRSTYTTTTLEQLTNDVFTKTYQSIKCDANRSKFIAVILNYRGMVSANEVSRIAYKHKNTTAKFVEWCPTGFKMCINNTSPTVIPESEIGYSDKSVTMLYNSTIVKDTWNRLVKKFELLYNKRAFMHWYINEGMEESEFAESFMDIQLLIEDYDEISLNEKEMIEMLDKSPSRKSRSLSLRPVIMIDDED